MTDAAASPRLGFIGGHGRSGSTLLGRVLSLAPGVFSLGEVCYLWQQGLVDNRLCDCGVGVRDCPFWTEVGQVAFGGWDNINAQEVADLRRSVERNHRLPLLVRPSLIPLVDRRVKEYLTYLEPFYRAAAAVSGCTTLIDGSKIPASAYVVKNSTVIDVRLIHLVRSSYGVCYSWNKSAERLDRDPPRRPPLKTAIEWDLWNFSLDALPMMGVATTLIKYEEFVADPVPVVNGILEFLGVEQSAASFINGQTVQMKPGHSVAGNPMRFRVGAETLRRDDAWKTALAKPTRRAISALTAPGLIRYGYWGKDRGVLAESNSPAKGS